MVTRAVEDYLKAIYKLQQRGASATTNAIAEVMGLRAASVTGMLRQLAEQGLAEYTPYRGAVLTATGRTAALRVIRRHRLIELFIHRQLGVPWDRVHEEAEQLEHAISPYLEERIDGKLGHPSFDPHGDPIPSTTGALPPQDLLPLHDLPVHTLAVVLRLSDDSPDLLRLAGSLGLVPEAHVQVLERNPYDGSLMISIARPGEAAQGAAQVIGAEAARRIFVGRPG